MVVLACRTPVNFLTQVLGCAFSSTPQVIRPLRGCDAGFFGDCSVIDTCYQLCCRVKIIVQLLYIALLQNKLSRLHLSPSCLLPYCAFFISFMLCQHCLQKVTREPTLPLPLPIIIFFLSMTCVCMCMLVTSVSLFF